MAYMVWSENYSVKIKSIDDQHKKLVDMINEFYENLQSKSNHELIAGLITKMKEYVIFHFSTEEKYFKQYNYPKFELHKKQHEEFVEKVTDLEKRFRDGRTILSIEITSFLKNWLVNHIQKTDKEYSDFLVENGVK